MITDGSRLMPVDCICQHNADGELIPLRIRIRDDDGEYQLYTIHECRQLELNPGQLTPEKVDPTIYDLVYECHVNDFGRDRKFRLYYNLRSTTHLWKINKTFASQEHKDGKTCNSVDIKR